MKLILIYLLTCIGCVFLLFSLSAKAQEKTYTVTEKQLTDLRKYIGETITFDKAAPVVQWIAVIARQELDTAAKKQAGTLNTSGLPKGRVNN